MLSRTGSALQSSLRGRSTAVGEGKKGVGTWVVMGAAFAVAAYFVWQDPEGVYMRLRSLWNSLPDLFPKF